MHSLTRSAMALLAMYSAWMAQAQPADRTDLHLTVAIHGGQSSFRIGETVPLELSFASDAPDFLIDMANTDRSSRTNYETFSLEPRAGWSDPLDLYLRSTNFLGGSRVNVQPLGGQPLVLAVDLNEWARFSQPGEYRLTVHSRRPSLKLQPAQHISAISNELHFIIVAASPEWQQEMLQTALSGLNNPATHLRSAKTLRYLGTEAAAREMAHRTQDADCRIGLASSPFRAAGLQEMHKLLRDAAAPIDRQFVDTMALLSVPDSPGEHAQEVAQFASRIQQELVNAIPLKQGSALMASVRTVLETQRDLAPEVRQALTDVLVANFDSLTILEQAEVLRNPAAPIERILLAPLLRKMAERYQDFPQSQSMEAITFNQLAGQALVEWYSMDPLSARPAVLREILRPKPRFPIEVLGILPDKQLPEAEQALVEHFETATDRAAARNLAMLIGRYGGAGSKTALLAHLDRDVAAGICDTEAPLLAWLLRVEPEAARARLENPPPICRLSVAEVGKLQASPLLEQLALKALDGPDGFAVGDAASYLTDYGSASVEEALWTHFTDWSKRWSGHEAQLNASPADVRAGQSIMQALVTGSGWIMSDTKLRRLAGLVVGPGQRQQMQQYLQIWATRPWLLRGSGFGQYQIGWYHALSLDAAEKKLDQFPKGSEFRWIAQGLPSDSATFKELAQFAANRGLKVW